MGQELMKNYIDGKWREPVKGRYLDVENPGTGGVIGKAPISTAEDVNAAVDAATQAFPGWSTTPVPRRAEYLYRLVELIKKDEEKLSRILTEEMGKSLADSRAEMKRVYQNIEAACGVPILQNGEKMIGTAPAIDGEILMLPSGVFGAITPFNFPAMAPFWFIPYAIATGNTFILKPSELVPFTAEALTEHIHSIGLPPGVFNLVAGDKEAAVSIIEHPDVVGVSFVGKTDTCKVVAANCVAHGKRFQAMGSAKNHLVVMPDYTHIDELIRNMSTSCFGCAGQRCMASSVIVAVGDEMYKRVCDRFIEDSKNFLVANPLDPKVENESMLMGPVITKNALDFIHRTIEAGINEGATLALDGRDITVEGSEGGFYVGPTVFVDVKQGMEIHRTEIFAPVVSIMKTDTLDEAIDIINNHQFSNACSIYTRSGYSAREFKLKARTGMIGVNVGIPAPVPFLPFGGTGNSMLSDIKMQGKSAIRFYTDEKVIVERFWPEE